MQSHKKYLFQFLTLIILITSILPFVQGTVVFESQPYSDALGDVIDFNACFIENNIVPMPIPIEIEHVDVTTFESSSTGETSLLFEINLNQMPLPHQSYTIEIGIDIDQDSSTGLNEPSCYFNGIGIDYNIGFELIEGNINSRWIEKFDGISWVKVDDPSVDLVERTIQVGLPIDILGLPLKSNVEVYLIIEGGLDIAPSYGEPPIEIDLHYLPVASFSIPNSIKEGTPFEVDASNSESKNGMITLYEWDFDEDELFEETRSNPIFTFQYTDDGAYQIKLRVTDVTGLISEYEQQVIIENTPPYDAKISQLGEQKPGISISFSGVASDLGEDELIFKWDFGDGKTAEGSDVTHIYDNVGDYEVILTVEDDDGAKVTEKKNVQVTEPVPTSTGEEEKLKPEIDPLLIVLIFFFGIGGFFLYDWIKKSEKGKKPKKEEKEKDFCEEHPEVVEAENKACWDAQFDLESAVGDVQDQYDEALPRWQNYSREIGRLLCEWDGIISLIAHWTKSEKELQADAEKVQKVAGIVTNAGGAAKTAFKKGGEEVMKDIGKDVAKDIASSILSELSDTVGQLLELEDWAVREIGLGIAKGLTGIDPKGNAIKLRKKSEVLLTQLLSWVSHSEAWNSGRRPPDTLPSLINDIQGMINTLDNLVKEFEEAVKDFKCVMCPIPEHISEEMDKLRKNLEKWLKTFNDLYDEVQKRLNQAKKLYRKYDLYESQYEYLDKADEHIERINRGLARSKE